MQTTQLPKLLLAAVTFSLFYFLVLLFGSATVSADDKIYTWTDDSGMQHYSTSPSVEKAKPADLPLLEKQDLDQRIKKIKAETPENCIAHGGVDCNAGADTDGSVLCLDGFRDAVLPYRFRCLEANIKSEMMLFYENTEQGVRHSKANARSNSRRKLREIRIIVRNNSAVEAFGIDVELEIPARVKIVEKLSGPEKVEPYGLADYTMSFDAGTKLTVYQVSGLKHRVRCENCR